MFDGSKGAFLLHVGHQAALATYHGKFIEDESQNLAYEESCECMSIVRTEESSARIIPLMLRTPMSLPFLSKMRGKLSEYCM